MAVDGDCSHEVKRCLLLGRKPMTNLDSILKHRDNALLTKVYSSPIWMWDLDHKEGWALKNWCFWTVVLEKTLESPLDCKEIKSVNPKGNQSGIFIGRTDAEAEAPILWPPNVKSQLIRKEPNAGKGWRQKKKGTTEEKKVGWHHRLNGLEFEQAPGDSEGQGSLVCCSPWGFRESEMTEWLNNNSIRLVYESQQTCLPGGGGYGREGSGCVGEGVYGNSFLSAHFCCESKTALKACLFF